MKQNSRIRSLTVGLLAALLGLTSSQPSANGINSVVNTRGKVFKLVAQ